MSNQTKKDFRLPREFAENWLEALESGEFVQGQVNLFSEVEYIDKVVEEYCCLGVAGIVCGYDKEEIRDAGVYMNHIDQAEAKYSLPGELIGTAVKGEKGYNSLVDKLIYLNDTKHYSFIDIANWIRENVEFY